jgi:hypothetical protein
MTTPKNEVDQKRDDALRRMLNTPRKPHGKVAPKKPVAKRNAKSDRPAK